MKFNKYNKKVFLIVVGFLLSIILLESSLRIAGLLYYKFSQRNNKSIQGKDFVILCLGDSFTWGLGADREHTYPRFLEGLLKNKIGENVVVVNRGVSGCNTAYILNRLEKDINEITPDLIIILAGENNYWSLEGFHRYTHREKLLSKVQSIYYRSRVYKLIKILLLDIRNEMGNSSILKLHSRWRRRNKNFDKNSYFSKKEDKHSYLNERECNNARVLFRNANTAQSSKRLIEAELDNIEEYLQKGKVCSDNGEYEEALQWFKKALKINSQDSRIYSYIGIHYFECIGKNNEAVKWFKKAIELDSNRYDCYQLLGQAYEGEDNDKAIMWYKKAIEFCPFNFQCCTALITLCIAENRYEECIQFLNKFTEDKPAINDFIPLLKEKRNIEEEIESWIISDINEIVQKCRQYDIKIMVLNYPGEHRVNRVLEKIAYNNRIPFVDNCKSFKELNNMESYFVPDGHCNAKGYGIMAENVFNKIMKQNLLE